MPYDLIDIGANLAHDSFDEDRAEMMQRAAAAGSQVLERATRGQQAVRLAQRPGRLHTQPLPVDLARSLRQRVTDRYADSTD